MPSLATALLAALDIYGHANADLAEEGLRAVSQLAEDDVNAVQLGELGACQGDVELRSEGDFHSSCTVRTMCCAFFGALVFAFRQRWLRSWRRRAGIECGWSRKLVPPSAISLDTTSTTATSSVTSVHAKVRRF